MGRRKDYVTGQCAKPSSMCPQNTVFVNEIYLNRSSHHIILINGNSGSDLIKYCVNCQWFCAFVGDSH